MAANFGRCGFSAGLDRMAAAQGLDTAIESLTDLGADLDPDDLATAQALSLEYWELDVAPFLDEV